MQDENNPMSDTPRPDREGIKDRSQGRLGRALRFVKEQGIGEVLRLARAQGVRGSVAFVVQNIRLVIAARADRAFDRRNRVDTAGTIPLEFLSIVGPNRDHGTEYVSTSPRSFAWMMQHLGHDLEKRVFIDFGSGKGRSLLLAAKHPFSRIIGVEFAQELAAVAEKNSSSESVTDRDRISVICGDAAEFTFPPEPLVLYFYNPFGPDVLRQVLANLRLSLSQHPRDCSIVYASSYPQTMEFAREMIGDLGLFEQMTTKPMPFFLDAVRSLHFAIFIAHGRE